MNLNSLNKRIARLEVSVTSGVDQTIDAALETLSDEELNAIEALWTMVQDGLGQNEITVRMSQEKFQLAIGAQAKIEEAKEAASIPMQKETVVRS